MKTEINQQLESRTPEFVTAQDINILVDSYNAEELAELLLTSLEIIRQNNTKLTNRSKNNTHLNNI